MSGRPTADIMADPAGDVISPRIQYLEQWIRDCQRYNRNVSAQLTANYDRIRDMESLLATKNAELRKAADRLAELGVEVKSLESRIQSAVQKVCDRFNMFRPPCPTCGGTQVIPDTEGAPLDEFDCPDCVDGKVSIEQLAATYNAVHGYHVVGRIPPTIGQEAYADGWTDAFAYLRAVKP